MAAQPASCNLTVTDLFVDSASGPVSGAMLSTGLFIVLIAVLGVFFTTTVILAVGCIYIRIKYRLEPRTGLGHTTEELQDDWVNIICCNVSSCCTSAPPGTPEEQTRLQSETHEIAQEQNGAFAVPYSEYDTPFSGGDRSLTVNFTEDASNHGYIQLALIPKSQDDIVNTQAFHFSQEKTVDSFEVLNGHPSVLPTIQMEPAESNDENDNTHRNLEVITARPIEAKAVVSNPVEDNDGADQTDLCLQAVASRPVSRSPSRLDSGICLMCENQITDPKAFSCGHKFCTVCLDQWVKIRPMCPKCGTIEGLLYGDQPRDGHMAMFYSQEPLPGCEGSGSFVIRYSFPPGHQSEIHPHPDSPYEATEWVAYLPDTELGRTVLMLLKVAFDRRLIFTIGTVDSGLADEGIVWSDIYHQTSRTCTEEKSGSPVSPDFKRTISDLKRKGVTEKDLTDPQRSFIHSHVAFEISTCDADVDFSSLFETLSRDKLSQRR